MPAPRLVLSFSLALLCSSLAQAQSGPAAPPAALGWGNWMRSSQPLAVSNTPHPSVARIIVQERDGVAFGSGTLVDVQGEQGLVITNWHVVRDASGPIEASFPDGYRSHAKVIKVDRDWDLAALVIWKPTAPPVALSATAPQPGETLTIAGYGSGNFRAATARCTQYVSPGHSLPYEMVEVGTEARQGDSGGPILNDRGEIAGVLFGAGGGTTSGSYVGRVRTFLTSVAPQLSDPLAPAPPQNIASTNPFLNPQGMPRLVHEANVKASAETPGVERPAAPGWHAAARPKAPAEDVMQPIAPTTPRVEVPRTQFASRTSQVTFGSLPSSTDPAPANLPQADEDAGADEPLALWSRPLPTATDAFAGPPVAPSATQATLSSVTETPGPITDEVWQKVLGDTLLDQVKSGFALLGVIAIALRLCRSSARAE